MITSTKPISAERHIETLDATPARDRPQKNDAKPKPRSRRGRVALAALCVIGLLGAAYHYLVRPVPNSTTPVAETRPPLVVGLGYIEPSSSVVKIGAPGSADALRIGSLKVGEGDQVETGQILAVLDTVDKLTAQVAASEATLKLKRLMLDKQKVEIASSVTARRSALERANAELDATSTEFIRQKTLLDRGVTTVANVEKKKRELLTAQASVREMNAALQRAETLAKSPGTAPGVLIDVAVTEQEVASAAAELAVVRATLELATIRAPFSGRILSIKTRAGERIGTDGVLEMGATDTMRAVVEIYQSDIGRVRVGQKVSVRAEIFGAPIAGIVERVGASVKRQSVVNNDPATATDARVVEVFVTFDEATSRRVASLSRLQVTAVFEP